MKMRKPYKLKSKKVVPSVTTIIGRFKSPEPLLYWANKIGREGLTLDEGRTPPMKAGTLAHRYIEAHTREGTKPEDLHHTERERELSPLAMQAYANFLRWQLLTRIEFTHSEVKLVSEEHKFGGTLDAIATINGKKCIVDFKTGPIYSDHIVQVAAYALLWNENNPDDPVGDEIHILSLKRDTADFAHAMFTDFSKETEIFLKMRELYELIKLTEKRI